MEPAGQLGHGVVLRAAARSTSCSRVVSGSGPPAAADAGELRVDDPLARVDPPDRGRQLLDRRVLQQEARGAGVHRPLEVARPAERRRGSAAARREPVASSAATSRPLMPGSSMSSSATSGFTPAGRRHRLLAGAHLGHDLDVLLQREQRGHRAPHHRLVLEEEDPDHRGAAGDRHPQSQRRSPARGPNSTEPPIAAMRSPDPRRPPPAAPSPRRADAVVGDVELGAAAVAAGSRPGRVRPGCGG